MTVLTASRLPLPLWRRGKVREVYEVDAARLLLVASDRVSTSDIERLTTCENAALGMRGTFSRTRSNTMIVS